jgi:nucleotide-binding universal stress UspA family protein
MSPPSLFEYGIDGPRTVLVGADGTTPSARAVDYALGHARRTRAHVVGVYVRPIAVPGPAALFGVPWADHQDTYDACLGQATSHLVGRAQEIGVRCVVLQRHGDPARELARAADEARADLVVVGSPAGFTHRLAGSVPASLVRLARWPVLVIP